jgi:hypothetical protein
MKKLICSIYTIYLVTTAHAASQPNVDFSTAVQQFETLMKQHAMEDDPQKKQQSLSGAEEYARLLLGVVEGTDFPSIIRTNIQPFCALLETKAKELEGSLESSGAQSDNQQQDSKNNLRLKRDIARFREIAKFLMICSALLEALYSDRELLTLVVERLPEDVRHIAAEIVAMLRVMQMVVSDPNNTEPPITEMLEFAGSAEDGTYLLSRLLSAAWVGSSGDAVNFKELLLSQNFPGGEKRLYLPIK